MEVSTGEEAGSRGTRNRKTVSSPHLHRLQLRHFLMFDIAPVLGTTVALGLLVLRPITTTDVVLFFALWWITGLA